MRMGWGVGQAGWVGILLIFFLGESIVLLTVFSMAALASNGRIRGGGSYFLVSRTLGPEFGGAVGLIFYLAYACGAGFYAVGFATQIIQTFVDPSSPNINIYRPIIATASLAVVMIISYAGANFFTGINLPVFIVQFFSLFIGIMSMYFGSKHILQVQNDQQYWYQGWNFATLKKNAWPAFSYDHKCGNSICTFQKVFGVLFSAMTGCMEGANLSGDLRNPDKDIGPGTIFAVFFLYLYVLVTHYRYWW